MQKRWHEYLIEFTSLRRSNIIEITGAVITLISLFLPWFKKIYLMSVSSVSGFELLLRYLFNGASLTVFSRAIIIYIFALSIYALISNKPKRSMVLSVIGMILFSAMLYQYPAPFESLAAGIIFVYIGLLLIVIGFFSKPTQAV